MEKNWGDTPSATLKESMCIVYNMSVVVTRSPFEAARSEVDVSEVLWMDIIGLYSHVDWKLIKT